MPVDTKHPDYIAKETIWAKCRAATQGEESVKAAGTAFLPKLGGQNDEQYFSYKTRAMFYGATGRTIEGITGVVFRKDPVVGFPESRRDWLDNLSQSGVPFVVLAKRVFRNVLEAGRHGIFLDLPPDSTTDVTPYVTTYNAESIINWRTRMIGGRDTLVMVVLEETVFEENPKDPFEVDEVVQYRVLTLRNRADASGLLNRAGNEVSIEDISALSFGMVNGEEVGNPVYMAEVWRKQGIGNDTGWVLQQVSLPKIRGRPVDYIPFVIVSPSEAGAVAMRDPPVLPIANVNLSHYRNSADLEHGRHFTALPTAWAVGFPQAAVLKIGSEVAWVTDEIGASAGFLEFSGAGLGHLAEGMRDKESLMAVLGARMLEEPKRAVESAETHQTRLTGEASVTASMAGTVESAWTTILRWGAEWLNVPSGEVEVTFNKDYVSTRLDAQTVLALMQALQAGRISWDTFIWNLQRGEWLPDGRTAEEELELIALRPPTPMDEADELDDEDEDAEDEGEEDEEDAEDEATLVGSSR
jgi:hypothetical protein